MNTRVWTLAAVLAFAVTLPAFGQWVKTYGGPGDESGYAQPTSDGGYIIVGSTNSFGASSDAWVLKLDAAGTPEWQRTYGGPADDGAGFVQQTADGGFLVAGSTSSFGAGSSDVWIFKLSSAGDLVWQRTYGGSDSEGAAGLALTAEGEAYIAATTKSFSDATRYSDIWVIKISPDGDIIWQRQYQGGTSGYCADLAPTRDGGCIVGGTVYGLDPPPPGYATSSIWLFKLAPNGDIQWQERFGHDWFVYIDGGQALRQTTDGGYILSCHLSQGGNVLLITKLQANGDQAWSKIYWTPRNNFSGQVVETQDGGYAVIAQTGLSYRYGEDLFLLKLSPVGDIQWQRGFGGSQIDSAWGLQQLPDGRFVFSGSTRSFGAGGSDIFLVKTSPVGEIDPACPFEASFDAVSSMGGVPPLSIRGTGLETDGVVAESSAVTAVTSITPLTHCSAPSGQPDIRTPITPIEFVNASIGGYSDRATMIYNDGDTALVVNNIARSSGSGEFTYAGPSTPFSVAPGGSEAITVRFAPSFPGQQSAQFTVDSNDPDEPTVTFDVSGIGAIGAPDIDLASTSLDFGDVELYHWPSKYLDLLIRNVGNADLAIESISFAGGTLEFSVMSFPSTIPAGGSGYARVVFAPRGTGEKRAQFDIASNDPDETHVIVETVGTAIHYESSPSSHKILPEAIWAPATGGGTWVSEVQVTDLTGGSVVSVYFNCGGGNRRGPFTLWAGPGPNTSAKFANILAAVDDLDPGAFAYFGRVGALDFLTQDSSHCIQVSARTRNGNYSKTFPGLNDIEAKTADTSRTMIIQNMVSNMTYRSTAGLYNPAPDPVTVKCRLFNGDGTQIGDTFQKTLAGHDFQAFGVFNEAGRPFPYFSYDNAVLFISPTSGAGRVMAFGATANNFTNDPAAHIASLVNLGYDNSPSPLKIVPEVIWAPATYGGIWETEVQITALTAAPEVSVLVDFGGGERRGPWNLWSGVFGSNRSVKYDNILQYIQTHLDPSFNYYGKIGALQFSGSYIQVEARTRNANCSKTLLALTPTNSNVASTGHAMMIQNLSNSSLYRSTIGCYNYDPEPKTVEYRLMDASGNLIGSPFTKTMAGNDFQAFSPFTEAGVPYPSYSLDNVWIRIQATSGFGSIVCFGASANNDTNDPAAHIAMQYQ